MSKTRFLSKLIIPSLLLAVYVFTLTHTIAEPEAPYSRTLPFVEATWSKGVQSMLLAPVQPDAEAAQEPILVVESGRFARTYRLADLAPGLSVFQARLGDADVVVISDGKTQSAQAFRAQVEGQDLQFSLQGEEIVDASGSVWSVQGLGLSGPYAGVQLESVSAFFTDWGTWLAAHPQASLSTP